MLLAPFALTDPSLRTRPVRVPSIRCSTLQVWLVAWAAAGTLALICFPSVRGGTFGGATLPFWLLGAPLINLAWITRARWIAGWWRRER